MNDARLRNRVSRRRVLQAIAGAGGTNALYRTTPLHAQAAKLPRAYYVFGQHGGYYFANQAGNAEAIAKLEEVVLRHPEFVSNMEFEVYALDRMANGERTEVEKKTAGVFKDPGSVERMRRLAQSGQLTIVSSYTQPLMFAIDGESVIRQFRYARKVVQETLGVPFEAYAAQEPCWFGQLPAVLAGFGMKGVFYATSWAIFGSTPFKNAEKMTWRGPDGSRIPVLPLAPYASKPDDGKPHYNRPEDGLLYSPRWAPPLPPSPEAIRQAHESGIEHPIFTTLGGDFSPRQVIDPVSRAKGVDVVYSTIPKCLEIARDGGVWEDAFAGFKSFLCWGMWGGDFYRDSHSAANKAVLGERLEVLTWAQWQEQLDNIRVVAMLSQHHDAWVCAPARAGVWRSAYKSLAELVGACSQEADRTLQTALKRTPAAGFTLCNPTQRRRREWTAVELELPEGAGLTACKVVGPDGRPVPSRIKAASGAPGRVAGYFLADVPAFGNASYRLGEGTDDSVLPVAARQVSNNEHEISNDRLKVAAAPGRVRISRGGREIVSNAYLDARMEGQPVRSQVSEVASQVTETGIARTSASGLIGKVPFTLTFELKPWSETVDIHVACRFNEELIEGDSFWDIGGALKLTMEFTGRATHLSNQAFELRKPSQPDYWAVHYSLSEWPESGGGCCTIQDRPTGVLYGDRSIGIVLCHSGSQPYGVRSTWPRGFGSDRVSGERTYDVSLFPYLTAEKPEAVLKYQTRAYPLTVIPSGKSIVPGLRVEGHSVVSALCREGDDLLLRLWNPLSAETARISAPGFEISACDLEGKRPSRLGRSTAAVALGPMRIQTLRLRKSLAKDT